ncbi:hypothetical protein GIB67_041624 [Kingdonia uniflora]|uniref:Uncharacterized protein n=1 Tax=Kingdonia uniflora TaxID=39325 RepID=A0A7J7MQK5_9MAGN|nr:hypothetical protein GIB67_041624 [Kingdonia uniflora]
MYYNGVYHLFYQYNPYGAFWGNIVWAHSTSLDLINWVHLDHAISPTEPFDINDCWSGSVTILPGSEPAILYTALDSNKREVQNLAVPKILSDPLLKEWIKDPQNPVMSPINGIKSSFFRDPTTAWQGLDGEWRIIEGNEREKRQGTALLYKSKDFLHWTESDHPLHSSSKTGMWKCPDFFPVLLNGTNGLDTSVNDATVNHILKVSLFYEAHDYYILGSYVAEEKYIPDKDLTYTSSDMRLDYRKFYASKTFFDNAKKRRILWGWINESDSPSDDIEKGWSGLQWPIKEIETLRENRVSLQEEDLPGASGFEVSGIKLHRSSLRQDLDKTTYGAFVDVDPSHEKLSLRTLIDHSVVESFGGEGRTCITARVYLG